MKSLRHHLPRIAMATFVAGGLGVLALVAPITSAGADPGHGNPAPIKRIRNGTSLNWSGYAATTTRAGTFTQTSASWTEPTVSCGSNETSYSAVWTGLDGDGSNTVEQTGTDADCSGGTPQYVAWYEMYPRFPVYLNAPVAPGDHLTASVTYNGAGVFTLTISDTAGRGWTFTTHQKLRSASRLSAEVIVEAPSSGSSVLPLADFGIVNVSASMVNGRPIGSFTPEEIVMAASDGTVKAQPSNLSGGTDFSVSWRHA